MKFYNTHDAKTNLILVFVHNSMILRADVCNSGCITMQFIAYTATMHS